MDKLRECPFCGGKPQTVNYYIESEWYCAIVCSECCLEMLSDEWADEQSAEAEVIAKWNTRYEPPTPGGILVPFGNARFNK